MMFFNLEAVMTYSLSALASSKRDRRQLLRRPVAGDLAVLHPEQVVVAVVSRFTISLKMLKPIPRR
jgi:hypothetical protein